MSVAPDKPPQPQSLKQRVRASFDRAATTYDDAAIVQRRACDRLLGSLNPETPPGRILDAGCGTGFGARILRQRWPQAHITGVDFAPTMIERAIDGQTGKLIADVMEFSQSHIRQRFNKLVDRIHARGNSFTREQILDALQWMLGKTHPAF